MPKPNFAVAARARRKRIMKLMEGAKGSRSRLYRSARQAMLKSLAYQYRDRRVRKRDMRTLWIVRINAAARLHDLSYSQFIHGLKLKGITLDRKVLADMAVNNSAAFAAIAAQVKQ
ncbi:MAG: 50S ribosomal protein L20 [Candidatus Chloroheliales bacterium]|nr:MAG: 50S ribosomal protein L20 [Chloroflexota bacterium]